MLVISLDAAVCAASFKVGDVWEAIFPVEDKRALHRQSSTLRGRVHNMLPRHDEVHLDPD